MDAQIVVDLTFGDAGKGMLVDNLCASKKKPLVIRYTGGPQAAHTVIRDGKKHIFSSYGSGTLTGAASFFSEDTLIYSPNLLREYLRLKELGIFPELFVDPLAKVITPYDVAWNRANEWARRRGRHGSCGLGIGATMHRHNTTPFRIFAADCLHGPNLKMKTESVQRWYEEQLSGRSLDFRTKYEEYLDVEDSANDRLDKISDGPLFNLATLPSLLHDYTDIVFEGAQGIMLDQDHGYFPHVTYGHTTTKNAWRIASKCPGIDIKEVLYVTRSYQTRHGAGPMTSSEEVELIKTGHETCGDNEWQGSLRVRELDYSLLNLALAFDMGYHPVDVKKVMVFTCMDQRPDFRIDRSKIHPNVKSVWSNWGPECDNLYMSESGPKH